MMIYTDKQYKKQSNYHTLIFDCYLKERYNIGVDLTP
jgi:hypothetical protein